MTRLRNLNIRRSRVGTSGIKKLTGVRTLICRTMPSTVLFDINHMTQLRKLDMTNCYMKQEGIADLRNLKEING